MNCDHPRETFTQQSLSSGNGYNSLAIQGDFSPWRKSLSLTIQMTAVVQKLLWYYLLVPLAITCGVFLL